MTEPVHQIGMTELYTEIRGLSERLTEFMSRQGVESAQLSLKVIELEKDLGELKSDLRSETVKRSTQSWQLKIAVITSLIFPLIVAVVTTLYIMKG
jgi:hypothetical protein